MTGLMLQKVNFNNAKAAATAFRLHTGMPDSGIIAGLDAQLLFRVYLVRRRDVAG